MKQLALILVLAGLVGAGALVLSHQSVDSPALSSAPRPTAKVEHYVNPQQLARSGEMTGRRIDDFLDASNDKPLVVVFIKHECPCSVDFEPFFHRLESAYGTAVRFVGVIDADESAAREYARANRVPYPVLADPELTIIRRFEAEHGSYVTLVRSDGAVAALWPGISTDMMQELSGQIARLARVPEQTIDVTGVPKALMTGCPYRKE